MSFAFKSAGHIVEGCRWASAMRGKWAKPPPSPRNHRDFVPLGRFAQTDRPRSNVLEIWSESEVGEKGLDSGRLTLTGQGDEEPRMEVTSANAQTALQGRLNGCSRRTYRIIARVSRHESHGSMQTLFGPGPLWMTTELYCGVCRPSSTSRLVRVEKRDDREAPAFVPFHLNPLLIHCLSIFDFHLSQ
jgi:hypothetical protein